MGYLFRIYFIGNLVISIVIGRNLKVLYYVFIILYVIYYIVYYVVYYNFIGLNRLKF